MSRMYLSKFLTLDELIKKLQADLEKFTDSARETIEQKIAYMEARRDAFNRMQITDIDRALIALIASHRFIATAPLITLCGNSWRKCETRLQKLWQRGYIKRF